MNCGFLNRTVLFVMLFSLVVTVSPMLAQTPTDLNVMPLPAKARLGSGALKIDGNFVIGFEGYREARLDRAAQRFLTQLHRETGIVLPAVAPTNGKPTLLVTTDHASKPVQEPGEDESYTLEVTSAGAKLHAANPLGVLRGLQTFLQLVSVTPDGFSAPSISIQDQPRFPWRGLMID